MWVFTLFCCQLSLFSIALLFFNLLKYVLYLHLSWHVSEIAVQHYDWSVFFFFSKTKFNQYQAVSFSTTLNYSILYISVSATHIIVHMLTHTLDKYIKSCIVCTSTIWSGENCRMYTINKQHLSYECDWWLCL